MVNQKNLQKVILILIVFEILFSVFLAYNHYANSGFCSVGSCNTVQNSEYGEIFGFNLNYLAVVAFILLFVFYKKNHGLYIVAITVGALSALYLISIQLFVLGQICSNCMIVDSVMILIAILSFSSKRYKKHLKKVFVDKIENKDGNDES